MSRDSYSLAVYLQGRMSVFPRPCPTSCREHGSEQPFKPLNLKAAKQISVSGNRGTIQEEEGEKVRGEGGMGKRGQREGKMIKARHDTCLHTNASS